MSIRTEKPSIKTECVVVNSVALEMKAGVVALAGPRMAGDSAKGLIGRAARRAGISFRLAKAFYYGETENPCSRGVERVRAALRAQEAKASASIDANVAALVALRDVYAATDPAFYGDQIKALEHAIRAAGREPRPVGGRTGTD